MLGNNQVRDDINTVAGHMGKMEGTGALGFDWIDAKSAVFPANARLCAQSRTRWSSCCSLEACQSSLVPNKMIDREYYRLSQDRQK